MDNINDIVLPEPEDYRVIIDQAIRETRKAIHEAIGYIKRQEDGPMTMRHALKDIGNTVTAIESEVWHLTYSLNRLQDIAAQVLEQRDEAIRQRDLAIASSGLYEYGEDAL